MCRFCCGARGPIGLTCNDRVGHDGKHHTLVNNVSEDGEMTEEHLILEWDRNDMTEAAWN